MPKQPYLTKSTFVYANQCQKWLWNIFYNRPDITPSAAGSPAFIGNYVGKLACTLFPEGVEITEAPWEYKEALQRTRDLMADEAVPAIFEAAFEHQGVRVRVDVLERLQNGSWGIREVKATGTIRKDTQAKPLLEKYSRDVAVQEFVVSGSGVNVSSVELVYIDKNYTGTPYPTLDTGTFFVREELQEELRALGFGIEGEASAYMDILGRAEEPVSEPLKSKCNKMPGDACPFWETCTADKPDDWINVLYRGMGRQLEHLKSEGKHRLSDMAMEDALTEIQKRQVEAVHKNGDASSPELASAVAAIPLPAVHLDFEYVAMIATPLYAGTKPFEKIPFQFSAHRVDPDGSFEHIDEFLAEGIEDPRREFAERLIALLQGGVEPVIVWNAAGAEVPVIKGLIANFPDLAHELEGIIDRVHDLAITMRDNLVLRKMISKKSLTGGLFSLKNVAPACSDGFSYGDLEGVTHGGQAVEAYFQMITDNLPEGVTREQLRTSMLAYCEKDTEATALVHQRLLEMGK